MALRKQTAGLTLKEKQSAIEKTNKAFIKKYKLEDNPTVRMGILSKNEDIGVINQFKTGNVAIDVLTGGFFTGLINVVYGEPGVGKTTHMRDMIRTIQEDHGAMALYMNQEKTMDREYWKSGGVNLDMLEVAEFETTEQSLDMCNKCASGEKPVDLLVIDTIQALSPEGEMRSKTSDKSVADSTMALLPRLYSQFLRMYTSANTGLTTMLISQIRTAGIGSGMPFDGMTGGNAIKHYCHLILQMKKSTSTSAWPYAVPTLPPNSYVVNYKIDRIKGVKRYNGLKLRGYFYKGSFDRRFNIIAIAKDLGIHNGKTFSYPDSQNPDNMIEYKSKGLNEMINGSDKRKLPEEALQYMYNLLEPKFLEMANAEMDNLKEEDNEEIDLSILEE